MTETKRSKITSSAEFLAYLEKLGIPFVNTPHPPAFTVEDGNKYWADIKGVHCKNIFCKDAKDRLWLIVAPANEPVNLKTLPEKIGSKRLSFASPAIMEETLGVTPGSVTPFGLINDTELKISVVLDKSMMEAELINFHPLENTATTTVTPKGLMDFIAHCGHRPQIAKVTES